MSGETEEHVSGWTVDTLHTHFDRSLRDLVKLLDERYVTQVEGVDKAFKAADTAVQAALRSAEKATEKAENASEKRFEAVNEFRGQLADQANTFLPRAEGNVRFNSLAEKTDQNLARITELELRLSARLDLDAGKSVGINATVVYVLAGLGALGTIVAIIIAIIGA